MSRDEDFTTFVAVAGKRLRRTAFMMTGNWHEAEDLTQAALTRLYVAWPRVHVETAEAYARTVLVRSLVDARRRFWRRERPTGDLPDVVLPAASPEDRLDLAHALAALPVGQRAVLVCASGRTGRWRRSPGHCHLGRDRQEPHLARS